MALGASKNDLQTWAHLALLPTILFYFLDSYYLGIERRFIEIENKFISAVKGGENEKDLIFKFKIEKSKCLWNTLKALRSMSTWPYYVSVILFVSYLKWGLS